MAAKTDIEMRKVTPETMPTMQDTACNCMTGAQRTAAAKDSTAPMIIIAATAFRELTTKQDSTLNSRQQAKKYTYLPTCIYTYIQTHFHEHSLRNVIKFM
jgi:hypothetical protein